MNFLRDLDVLVLGLGESGLAMARWCARCGATVTVWDSREAPPQAAALSRDVPSARLLAGDLPADAASAFKLVLKSPGLAPADVRIAALLAAARAAGIAVAGELDLFTRALADLKAERGYQPRVLAITGTNGKTTTTALTALLVGRAGRRVAVAGNIGPTMLDTLGVALDREAAEATAAVDADPAVAGSGAPSPAIADEVPSDAAADRLPPGTDPDDSAPAPLDEDAPLQLAPPPPAAPVFAHLPEVWILELSSFQLDGVRGFEPAAATVLNVTQDHLDWHGTMEAYAAAKARVFGEQATMVVNRDDVRVEAMIPPAVMQKGSRGKPAKAVHRKVVRFGLDAPQRPGDYGLVVENGMAWLVRALEADETLRKRTAEDDEIHLQRLMPADALRIRGRHNAANALAALALATSIGCALAPMLHGLRDYRGEPHRVEFIASIGGVEAFDDSKGTNVGATVAALEGLGADKAPSKVAIILGGDGKGQDFSPLAAPIARHARVVALIGRDAPAIEQAIAASCIPMRRLDTLPDAVEWCFAEATSGDAVLLSPACASFDMFRHYAHRAEVFADAVRSLAADRGEALA